MTAQHREAAERISEVVGYHEIATASGYHAPDCRRCRARDAALVELAAAERAAAEAFRQRVCDYMVERGFVPAGLLAGDIAQLPLEATDGD